MDVLFDCCYYLALFSFPIAMFALLFQDTFKKKYTKDWYYSLKYQLAKSAVRKYQKKCKESVSKTEFSLLEQVKEITNETLADNQFIYGVDQKGNNITIRFTVKTELLAEVDIKLRLKNGATFKTNESSETVRPYRLSRGHWKTKDLHIQILEPFKRLRIIFNGLLYNNNRVTEHVQFNFIWSGASAPSLYPQDAATATLASAIASETWRDGDWLSFLGDERGYEQFGCLRGIIRGDSFPEEHELNLGSVRTRSWGTAHTQSLAASVHLFCAGWDGTLFSLWAKTLNQGCQSLVHGNALSNNGKLSPIISSDILVERFTQKGRLPPALTVHMTVESKVYKAVLHLDIAENISILHLGSICYNLNSTPSDCSLNDGQGKGLVEIWKPHEGRHYPSVIPPILLSATNVPAPKTLYVCQLNSEEAKSVAVTGGKGSSLAMLTAMQSNDFIVPEGFVVTVNAFNKQIESNQNIQKSISNLDDIVCGRISGDLKEACLQINKLLLETSIPLEITKEILELLKNQEPGKWAIRSSGVSEDSEDLSAAGQNQTILGCSTPNDIIGAISTCWGSLYSPQSVQYRHQHGLPIPSQMAVVIQRMVASESAGVMFTHHPTTGSPAHLVITSNHGLGESVVSGQSDPDTIILSRSLFDYLEIETKTLGEKNKMIVMKENNDGVEEINGISGFSLSDEQALTLGNVGVAVENAFGSARDIEWAWVKGRVYLLQARPITTLEAWTDFELTHEFDVATLGEEGVYTRANTGEVLPGAVTVLTSTTVVMALEKGTQININQPYNEYLAYLPTFQHQVFLDVINLLHRNSRNSNELTPKILDLAIVGHPIITEAICDIASRRFGRPNPLREMLLIIPKAFRLDEHCRLIKEESRQDITLNSGDNILEMYQKIDIYLAKMWKVNVHHTTASQVSVFYQIIAMQVLAEGASDLTFDHYNDIASLLSSCEDVISVEIPKNLEKIAEILIQQGKSPDFSRIEPNKGAEWLRRNCPEASTLFESFIEKHGHRVLRELEISARSWAMEPEQVIAMIQTNCRTNINSKKSPKSLQAIIDSLTTPKRTITRTILKFIMVRGRKAVSARELCKSELVRVVDKLRRAYRELSRKMTLAGIIPNEEIIFHFSHFELGLILLKKDSSILIQKALRRQRLYQKWNQNSFPEMCFGTPELLKHNENIDEKQGGVKCVGTPVCAGTIKARACVITSLDQIDQLQKGDVLITHCTDIGWSPYFPILSGVITELGGLVSHGAVIAREYGLPCIVGVQGATKIFKTGDFVVVSGKNGTIALL